MSAKPEINCTQKGLTQLVKWLSAPILCVSGRHAMHGRDATLSGEDLGQSSWGFPLSPFPCGAAAWIEAACPTLPWSASSSGWRRACWASHSRLSATSGEPWKEISVSFPARMTLIVQRNLPCYCCPTCGSAFPLYLCHVNASWLSPAIRRRRQDI